MASYYDFMKIQGMLSYLIVLETIHNCSVFSYDGIRMNVIDEVSYLLVLGLYALNALSAMEVTSVLRHTRERDWSSDAVNTRANE